MRPDAFRFRPPPFTLDAETIWVLRRAFAAPECAAALEDPKWAVEIAERLDLGARIAARTSAARLEAELGVTLCGQLRAARTRAAARGLLVLETTRLVTAVAESEAIGIAWLKYAALAAHGLDLIGARGVADLDLLAPEHEARRLSAALLVAGCRVAGASGYEHHLPALIAPSGLLLEIHTRLPGVRLGGRQSARFADLAAAGLLDVARGPIGVGLVPARPALVAHLLVHALAQHGSAPAAYRPFRLAADLSDLGLGGATSPALPEAVVGWVARDLSRRELNAALTLTAALSSGDLPNDGERRSDARLLLDHWLAGAFDLAYGERLKLTLGRGEPTDRGPLGERLAWLGRALWPSAAELAAIYGPPIHRWSPLLWRLGRPFDLLRRYCRALIAR